MGFFSARRPEDYEQHLHDDRKVVRVIRSRFYGKHTGNAHSNTNPPSQSSSQSPSVPRPSRDHTKSPPRSMYNSSPRVVASPRRSSMMSDVDTTNLSHPSDAITTTLAQRLDELAVANTEGLLNDDEYRLLRQSLFDRFASGSALPSEAPLVPVAILSRDPSRDERTSVTLSHHHRRPSSSLNRQSPRATSAPAHKLSFTSTVAGMFKRATARRRPSDSMDSHKSETNSIFSTGSSIARKSGLFRRLSKHTSAASLRTDTSSLSPPDLFSSHRTFDSNGGISLMNGSDSISRSTTRSARRVPTSPPSSYHRPGVPTEIRRPHTIVSTDPDDEYEQSAQDIRHEIEMVEAERRSLLDTFNGLELNTLVQQTRSPTTRTPLSRAVFQHANMQSDDRSMRSGKEMDSTSIKSSGSMRTTGSMRRLHIPSHSAPPLPNAVQLLRKNSVSTMSSSHSYSQSRLMGAPASPLVSRPSVRRFGSTSSVNLARSTGHLPLATVAEVGVGAGGANGNGDSGFRMPPPPASTSSFMTADSEASLGNDSMDVDDTLTQEMADIRKGREEVAARYEARLEYLRARLKGAELREKLMKK